MLFSSPSGFRTCRRNDSPVSGAAVEKALKPQGRVFFIDSRFEQTSTARNHVLDDPRDTVIKRRLNDGREFNIVKVFYENKELEDKLRDLVGK
jgi:hypothetical protein